MKKSVSSTRGNLDINDLGTTLMHEHIYCGSWEMYQSFGKRWINKDYILRNAVKQLIRAKELGIDTIVDGTPANLGRDIELIRKAADMSGINIIVSTGLYVLDDFCITPATADRITDNFVHECVNGIGETSIKPGILKCGTDVQGLTAINKIALGCIAQVNCATGLPIFCHSVTRMHLGNQQLELFQRFGVQLNSVIIGHCGDIDDYIYYKELLSTGCYIGIDRFNALESPESQENRIKTLCRLKEDDLLDKVMLSEDHWILCDSLDVDWNEVASGGCVDDNRDYTFLHRNIIPRLVAAGFTSEDIYKLFVVNPAAFFAGI